MIGKRIFLINIWNEIQYYCLVMSQHYIKRHFLEIKEYANAIEQRIDDTCCTVQSVLAG